MNQCYFCQSILNNYHCNSCEETFKIILMQHQEFGYHRVNIILNDVRVILFFDSNTVAIYNNTFNLFFTLPFINITPANVHDKVATYLLFQ